MAPLSSQNATAAISCTTTFTAHDGSILCSWVNNPGTRGTLNILWLCVSTLGLCVWNAVHPDVPHPGTPKWRVVGKRIWWLFVGLFMPELLVLTALGEFRQACTLLVRLSRETRVPTELPWWLVQVERLYPTPLTGHEIEQHGKYLPLPVRCEAILPPLSSVEPEDLTALIPTPASDASLPVTPPTLRKDAAIQTPEAREGGRKHAWTLAHSFYAVMHGFLSADGDPFWTTTTEAYYTGTVIVVFDTDKGIQRISAASHDPFSIPDLSADDLDDRSKAGTIAKALLVWQFSVFIANCAARWNQSLPLSLLEITTLAHCLCSLVALGLWWYKPHSVGEAAMVGRTRSLPQPPHIDDLFTAAIHKVLPGKDTIDIPRTIAIIAIAVLYGLPHLLGFSVNFPTSSEQRCWQLATFTVICSPLIMCLMFRIGSSAGTFGRLDTVILVEVLFVIVYPMSTMFLVGESMRQIFALPEGSFHQPQLTRYLASFS
ncbi:hypothetical protein EXIGLDRAFT_765422 [Exidia glandulosa HHB12029]|uniref:Uncharacterized protein n=1 Tax=Exidia glandulosa HHB12029 TaxID=1314781 RepID=A0A166AYP9_EXIGL|nr:hypothetical protein EXIGLDRAFT_765422 [Exidia glandulosa HHB12029]